MKRLNYSSAVIEKFAIKTISKSFNELYRYYIWNDKNDDFDFTSIDNTTALEITTILPSNIINVIKYETYSEAERFLTRIINKLDASDDELLNKVAASYKKWKVGIVNGLAKNQTGKRFSNAIAEGNNSHIQKIINVSYGYRNFKRFRARIMLILTYKIKG